MEQVSFCTNTQRRGSEEEQLLPKMEEKQVQCQPSCSQKNISVPVYLLIIAFAMASWIDINGVFVETPLLVTQLPEGWALPSYMTLIIQIANIGPLVYTLLNKLYPNVVKEWRVVCIIIFIGAVSMLLLVFFWKSTAYVGGVAHSVAFLTLVTLLSLVDCTSSVVFLPYMALYGAPYMTALYIGEGFSGLVPGILGLMQGVGTSHTCVNTTETVYNKTTGTNFTRYVLQPRYSPPLYSVEVFFSLMFILLCISGTAFLFLHFSILGKKARLLMAEDETKDTTVNKHHKKIHPEKTEGSVVSDCVSTVRNESKVAFIQNKDTSTFENSGQSRDHLFILLLLTAWLNALSNGIVPAMQSFSCLPYGNMAYTLTVRLSNIVNPLVCFFAFFVQTSSVPIVCALVGAGTAMTGYQVFLAAMSPSPPLMGTDWGIFFVVVTGVLLTAFFSYAKVLIATILREYGHSSLLWCGIATQLGSFIGAITSFLIVSVLRLLKDSPPC